MARQRRRGTGLVARAYGKVHDSTVKPPIKPRTMDQIRFYKKPTVKNLYRPMHNWDKRVREDNANQA